MCEERPLAGGMDPSAGGVRVGDTVRRPAGPSSAAVRALLLHLEAVGFEGAPRFLGVDEAGRDVLSFLDGDVPLPPYPRWALTDAAVEDLGRLLRRYHEAVAGFDAGAVTGWSREWADPGGGPVVCHNDVFPENVVFRGGRVVALIDFAMAAPGRHLWDLAVAAQEWAPLQAPGARLHHPDDLDGVRRTGLLARAYGVDPAAAEEFVDVITRERVHSLAHVRGGRRGVGPDGVSRARRGPRLCDLRGTCMAPSNRTYVRRTWPACTTHGGPEQAAAGFGAGVRLRAGLHGLMANLGAAAAKATLSEAMDLARGLPATLAALREARVSLGAAGAIASAVLELSVASPTVARALRPAEETAMTTLPDRPNTALLVIDVQNGVVAGAHDRDAVVANIGALVERARGEGVPVVWVQHSDEQLVKGSEPWAYVPELPQRESEPVVHKSFGDSFEATDLEDVLACAGVGHLVVAGAQTDACIRSTIHGAFARGYDVTLVGDAHTTEDQSEWGAPPPAQVIAHTNLYWRYQDAPGRTAGVTETQDVTFGRP